MTEYEEMFSEKAQDFLEQQAEEGNFNSVDEMLDAGQNVTLSTRIPVQQFAKYITFVDEQGYPSKSEATRDAIRQQMLGKEREKLLLRGWSTYLAGLNNDPKPDPNVAALGLDTLYEADKAHGEIAEKYMEPLMNKLREYEEQEE